MYRQVRLRETETDRLRQRDRHTDRKRERGESGVSASKLDMQTEIQKDR